MTAIVLKDYVIVAPHTLIPPYTLDLSHRVCGVDRDFFALNPGACDSSVLLEGLSKDMFKHMKVTFSGGSDAGSNFHVIHKSGNLLMLEVDDLTAESVNALAIDLLAMKDKGFHMAGAEKSMNDFLYGFVQNNQNPYDIVREIGLIWADYMPCYSIVPTTVFLEWLSDDKINNSWPFPILPEGETISFPLYAPGPEPSAKPRTRSKKVKT